MQEAHIAGVGTAVPFPISTERAKQHDRYMREQHGQDETIIQQLHKFIDGTGIHTRHYAHAHWLPEGIMPSDMPQSKDFSLTRDIFTDNNFLPPYWERMSVFQETAVALAITAAKRALADWGGKAEDITHIFTTCTSGWSEPGVAVAVMRELGLPLNCQKAELNFNGCFCGATCLRMARDAIRSGNGKNVLVVAVEVASTHYDLMATDPSSLVAHSLFADGAAAMIFSTEGEWEYQQTGMSLIPDSEHLLGLFPPSSPDHSAYRMTLHRRVGKSLGDYFEQGLGKELLNQIQQLSNTSDKPALAIHPGGPNILDNVGNFFYNLGWQNNALAPSYDTLQSHGNLGAAAMLFVLAQRIKSIEESELITMAFGPGVTVEWAFLRRS